MSSYEETEAVEEGNAPTVNDDDDASCAYIVLRANDGFIRRRKSPKVIRFRGYRLNRDPSNYFREVLKLQSPWRNEAEQTVNIDHEVVFMSKREEVLGNRAEFTHLDDAELQTALDKTEKNAADREGEEEDDNHAPRPNPLSQYEFLDELRNQQVDILAEMGEYQQVPYAGRLVQPSRLFNGEYDDLVAELNTQQRDFLYDVLHQLSSSIEPCHYLLAGGAGTGKSLLVSALFQGLMRLYDGNILDHDRQLPSVLLCAPTGMAAFNIQGQALHAAFHLPVNQHGNNLTELSADVANTMRTHLLELQVVIIDEIFMVSEKHLRWIEKRLRDIFTTQQPFGGKSVIAVGDFNQLPPVMALPVYSMRSSDPYAEPFGTRLWDLFTVHTLTTIMRQREDADFANALSNMARGSMTPADISLFQSRIFASVPSEVATSGAIYLFHRNVDVDQWNASILGSMEGESIISEALDSPFGFSRQADGARLMHAVRRMKLSDTMGLPTSLHLRVGARYMITVNIDTAGGLVNGVTGRLRRIDMAHHRERREETRPLRV